MALESDLVTVESIDARAFPEVAAPFNVKGVPHTEINSGQGRVIGSDSEEIMLEDYKKALDL
jgi:hypothetical protein